MNFSEAINELNNAYDDVQKDDLDTLYEVSDKVDEATDLIYDSLIDSHIEENKVVDYLDVFESADDFDPVEEEYYRTICIGLKDECADEENYRAVANIAADLVTAFEKAHTEYNDITVEVNDDMSPNMVQIFVSASLA